MIKTFLIESTGKYKLSARRYCSGSDCHIHGYHDMRIVYGESDSNHWVDVTEQDKTSLPFAVKCDCGYEFLPNDEWQIFREEIYKRKDTGELLVLGDAPVGAVWRSEWLEGIGGYNGPDGKCYTCRTPGGDWVIDSQASNCTRPNEPHHCWVRHGEAPDFHVDKNGNTCAAGAGSIQMKNYHGFLHNGYLTPC